MIKRQVYDYSFLTTFSILMVWASWIGHTGADDQVLANAALSWTEHFPYIGTVHHSLRLPVVLTLAVCFQVFGVSEFVTILPSIFYYLCLIYVTYFMIRHRIDRDTALICGILVSCLPLFSVSASITGVDIPEVLCIGVSVFLFFCGVHNKKASTLFFLAGIFWGIAWLNRMSASGIALFYLLLFVFNYGKNRKALVVNGFGALSVFLMECVYYFLATGNPIYRIQTVMASHVKNTTSALRITGSGNDIAEAVKSSISGDILEPLFVLMFNQEFAVLFFITIIILCVSIFRKHTHAGAKALFFYISVLMLFWYIYIAYIAPVRPLPRYFGVTAYCACLVCGIFIGDLWKKKKLIALGFFFTLIGFNFLGIVLENKHVLYGERHLVELTQQYNEIIYTDYATFYRSRLLLKIKDKQHMTQEASISQVPDKALFYYNPNRILEQGKKYIQKYTPSKQWQKIASFTPKRRMIGKIFDCFGLSGLIPTSIFKKLNFPYETTILYRKI